jgi:SAM-dependent methyltransferase
VNSPDWNALIQRYSAEGQEHVMDRRYDIWICGYIPQGQMLADMVTHRPARVLDFGCGNGRMSRFLSRWHGYEVVGVDISPESIRRARSFSDEIDYHLIAPDSIPADLDRFDACVCNHVFSTYSSLSGIRRTLAAIRGALHREAPILVYVDNTHHTAVRYSSFMAGVPGARYQSGDPLPMEIRLNGEIMMKFEDFYWSPEDYVHALAEAGFSRVDVAYPVPTSMSRATYESYFNAPVEAALSVEATFPPAAIYVGMA